MWRPKDWKKYEDEDFAPFYEEGADAMLEALRKDGKRLEVFGVWYGTHVFIPDEDSDGIRLELYNKISDGNAHPNKES